MKKDGKRSLIKGSILLIAFLLWTILIKIVDVQSVGQNGMDIGFATFNQWFHAFTGVHMLIYTITDWLGLVPIFICAIFAGLGLVQLVKRRDLRKVDYDILFLGIYYVIVIFAYLFFEMLPLNYRPVLIGGYLEASYPSSTTLLVLSVMPTLNFQLRRRMENCAIQRILCGLSQGFAALMVIGRLFAGVHWFTDIVGSILLSAGLFLVYSGVVLVYCKEE